MAGDNRSPRLVWTVESLSQIKSYELLYRRQEADADTWLSLKPKVLPSSDGIHYSVVHDLYGLEPGTYEAVLRAENAYGWSYPSPPSYFSGEGKRLACFLPPCESSCLTPSRICLLVLGISCIS